MREAYRQFKNLAMLWSIGKDSTVLLWLARKAFFGHVPLPLVHIDTSFKIPEMIEYRDRLAREWKLNMVYGQNKAALDAKQTFPAGAIDRLTCCKLLKSEALKHTLAGDWPRYRLNHATSQYEIDKNTEPYTGVIVGVRADEETVKAFSPRAQQRLGHRGSAAGMESIQDRFRAWDAYSHPSSLDWTEDIWNNMNGNIFPSRNYILTRGGNATARWMLSLHVSVESTPKPSRDRR